MKPEISKIHSTAEIATLQLPTYAEHSITVQSSDHSKIASLLRCTAEERDATILSQFIFSCTHHYEESTNAVWLQGDACKGGGLYSMQAVGLSGIEIETITFEGRDVGFIYEDEYSRICRLCGMMPRDLNADRAEQTRSTFETINEVLQLRGFKFTDTVRTWIYLDKLLEWYDEFNVVRTAFFEETGIFDAMVPASTGIGAGNHEGAAIMMDVLAIQPKNGDIEIKAVKSPLQNPALDYRSSFSRAVEIDCPTHRKLLISGTASIDAQGNTVHLDDPEKQIRLTMDVVVEIMKSRGMDWNDIFRGIAYFKDMDYKPIYEKVAAELGIPKFPLAIAHADVCRHDLLFEIEVDAIKLT